VSLLDGGVQIGLLDSKSTCCTANADAVQQNHFLPPESRLLYGGFISCAGTVFYRAAERLIHYHIRLIERVWENVGDLK